jgi:hypothetical protein
LESDSDELDSPPDFGKENEPLSREEIYEPIPYMNWPQTPQNPDLPVATVEVPLEALVKELGAERAVEFISEIRARYGDSIVEQKKPTETFTIQEIEAEVQALKKK